MAFQKRGLSSEEIDGVSGGVVGSGNVMYVDDNDNIYYNGDDLETGKRYRMYRYSVYDNETGKRVAVAKTPELAKILDTYHNTPGFDINDRFVDVLTAKHKGEFGRLK